MRKGIFVGMAALLVISASAQAAVIFEDNFEGYASDAEMKAVWNGAAGSAPYFNTNRGLHASKGVTSAGGAVIQKNFTSLTPTDAAPLVVEFHYWDRTTGTADRNSLGVRSASAIYEFGEYNAMDPDINTTGNTSVQGYGFRTVYMGGPSELQSWVAVTPANYKVTSLGDVGYHRFSAIIRSTSITVKMALGNGNVYSKTVNLTLGPKAVDNVRIGGPSGNSSTGFGYYDNVKLYTVPEPASMLLLGLGGLLLRRRRA